MPSPLIRVESSSLATVAYDAQSATLQIEFRDGGRYQYAGVPADLVSSLLQADSKGRFFNEHVRPNYAHQRMR